MTHCQAALHLLSDDDPLVGDLLLRYAGSALLAEAQDEARLAYAGARRWFEEREDRASAAMAAHGLGPVCLRQEALDQAQSALEAARDLLGDARNPEVVELAQKAHDLYQLRHVYSWGIFMASVLGEWPVAESMFGQQLPIVESLLGQEPTAFLQVCRGFYLYHRGRYEEARDWLTRGLTVYRAFGTDSLAWHLGLLGLTDAALGDFRAARRCLDELDELIAALPAQNFQRGCALVLMANTVATMRDRERAATYYPLLEVFSGLHFWFLVDRGLGALALLLGEKGRAANHLETARATTEGAGHLPELARTLVLQAELAVQQVGVAVRYWHESASRRRERSSWIWT